MTHMMLVGNPNCGKTTLFNALTGDHQRIGNWPGVTVEKKTGQFIVNEQTIQVTDLPGIYSLVSSLEETSQDVQIAAWEVAYGQADILVNVVDACHLERHLYLTSQLLELGKPLILALNMMDLAEQQGISIDINALSEALQCPVVMLQAHKKIGLDELKQKILAKKSPAKPFQLSLPSAIQGAVDTLEKSLKNLGYVDNCSPVPTYRDLFAVSTDPVDEPRDVGSQMKCQHTLGEALFIPYLARRLLEGDTLLLSRDKRPEIKEPDIDLIMADARYHAIHQIITCVQKKCSDASEHFTAKLDRIVLHRFWAFPIFFGMMYLMFLFAVNVGGAFQDFFDISTDALFVQGSAWLLQQMHAPNWLIALIANGIGTGINTTLTFIPVIASMFFFLSLLETSGYMARAAFVVDKAMRALGLPGKSFVPMIVGFGCNVPAIMAARTLDSTQDRLLTVLMSPFMSCSARLAIYAVFVAAFFPQGGQNIVFSLYLIGILMAVFTGFLARKTMLRGQASPLILELPSYHRPSLRRLCKETSLRLRHFIWRAGKIIIPVCVLLGGLNALTIHGDVSSAEASGDSLLAFLGQWLTPLFAPMGIQADNWPATVGLLSGMLAKEVVVGSLNTLYLQMSDLTQTAATHFDIGALLKEALWTIPQNLKALGSAFINPILASAPSGDVPEAVYGIMYQHFDGKVGAYAYLLFILLYIPCVSTMAAIRQEANRKLMWFSITWSFIVAYAAAVLFYQFATISAHPEQTWAWCLGIVIILVIAVSMIRISTNRAGGIYAA